MLPLPLPLPALNVTHATPFAEAVQLYPTGQFVRLTVSPEPLGPQANDAGDTVHIPAAGNKVTAAVPLIAGFPVLVAATVTFWLEPMLAGAW